MQIRLQHWPVSPRVQLISVALVFFYLIVIVLNGDEATDFQQSTRILHIVLFLNHFSDCGFNHEVKSFGLCAQCSKIFFSSLSFFRHFQRIFSYLGRHFVYIPIRESWFFDKVDAHFRLTWLRIGFLSLNFWC